MFDKSWRMEGPNTFGTDKSMDLCRKIGCEPSICTNDLDTDIQKVRGLFTACFLNFKK